MKREELKLNILVVMVMAATVLTIMFILLVVIGHIKLENKKLEYCTTTPVSDMQDAGKYSECLKISNSNYRGE